MNPKMEYNRLLKLILLLLVGWGTAVAPARAQDSPVTPAFEDANFSTGFLAPRLGRERITGQAWGDYNQDGWLDLYVTDFGGPNRLYRNNQDGALSLSPLSDSVALPNARSGGAQFVDYNNDGWPDLYVMNWGANTLFRNDAGQGFTDVTAEAGVGDTSNGKTASWGDYDNDGFLDLYLANWSCSPECGRPTEGDRDTLYRNNGDGTFSDVTHLLGTKTRGAGFVATFVDYDNDGDLDIYLINDEFLNPIGNQLWRNDGPGCDGWCFTNVSVESGADTYVMGMGLATADYNNNGYLDFYFSNAGPMVLLQNQGDGAFRDVALEAGVQLPNGIGWGAIFLDYNNDGWQDLYLAIMESTTGARMANPLFHNNGDGTFTNLGEASGAGDKGRTIGVAYADYDQDGWVDMVIGNFDEGYVLYRNVAGRRSNNNWLTLKLVGAGSVNRDGVGARATVTTSSGLVQMQEVKNGSSLGSGDALELHFGLGQATVESVVVRWPDGAMQTERRLPTNQRHTINYDPDPEGGNGRPSPLSATAASVLACVVLLGAGITSWTRRARLR